MRATATASAAVLSLVVGLYAQQPTMTNSIGMELVLVQAGKMTVGVFHPPYARPVDPNAPPPAGRGGGNGTTLAPRVLADGDANTDQRVTRQEFSALADKWFDRMDSNRAGRLNQADFAEQFAALTAPSSGPAGGGGGRGGRGGAAQPLFTAADLDRDGYVARAELKALFDKWAASWDPAGASLEQLTSALNVALPQPVAGRGTPLTPAEYTRIERLARADYRDGFVVSIERPYYIGKYEVTQEQWKRVMGTNPSLFQGAKVTDNADRHPVDSVSWADAQAFVKKLNALEKTDAYRLPTEFEWEYAARAGGDADIPWAQIREQGVVGFGSIPTTREVGGMKANAWGLHDTLGNVWEWVQDYYNEKIFADPVPPKAGIQHVLKGGGFVADVKNAIPATHDAGPANTFDVGFRIVRDVR
jgi:formylglycine-generating enzyme required for sulfatase activity